MVSKEGKLTAKPIYDRIHSEVVRPVVRITSGRATGSGTVIYCKPDDEDGFSTYVLTNEHVVDDLIKFTKKWSPLLRRNVDTDDLGVPTVEFFEYKWKSRSEGGTNVQSDIVGYDKDADLALLRLRLSRQIDNVAKLYGRDKEKDLRVGMPVLAVGSGLGQPPLMTYGRLSQFGQDIGEGAGQEFWLNTAPAIFGNSGGALFLEETFEFIGIPSRIGVSGGMFGQAVTHLQWAIPITRIYKFLEDNRFRFIYDDSFTEKGEEKERARLRKGAEQTVKKEEDNESGVTPPAAPPDEEDTYSGNSE